MSNFLEYDTIEEYLEEHSIHVPEYLLELERETRLKLLKYRMMSGRAQGRFLSFLSSLIQPKRILEIGSFSGYSALCLAEGLKENGVIDSIEVNDELKKLHEDYLIKSNFGSRVNYIYGEAKEIIPNLTSGYDLIFLDADKKSYPLYLDLLTPLLKNKGILLADNVLWYDRVIDETIQDEETNAIREFNKRLSAHPEYTSFILPVRDGLSIAQKKKA